MPSSARVVIGLFFELGRHGVLPLGSAVFTSAGRLPFRGLIHVAGINLLWRASPQSVQGSVRSAMTIAGEQGLTSLAFPVVGAGVGGYSEDEAIGLMLQAFEPLDYKIICWLVRFRPKA